MERRAKVELFEQIRREYDFGVETVLGVARKLGIHRRMVRQHSRTPSHLSESGPNANGRSSGR
jgi:hypothetical protein